MTNERRVLDHSKYGLSGVGSDLDFESIRADIPLSVEESRLPIEIIEDKMAECDREYNKGGSVKWYERGQYRALSDKCWLYAYTLILVEENNNGEFVRAKMYWRPYDPSEELKHNDVFFGRLNSMEITKDEIKQLADDYRKKSYSLNRAAGWRTISYRMGSDSLGLMFKNRKNQKIADAAKATAMRSQNLKSTLDTLKETYSTPEIQTVLQAYEDNI